jgi:hypothetical protein
LGGRALFAAAQLTQSKKRLLYISEALVIVLATVIGLYPSLVTIAALISFPALILAVRGAVQPAFLDPRGVADPRGWYRKYVHLCAAVCAGLVIFIGLNIAIL